MDTLLLRPDGLDYKYSIRLALTNCKLGAEEVGNYIDQHFWGNSLEVICHGQIIQICLNTDKPWEILQYCDSLGDIVDVTIENRMQGKKIFTL